MKKLFLLLAITFGVVGASYAQKADKSADNSKEEVVAVDKAALIKEGVNKDLQEGLERMKTGLESDDPKDDKWNKKLDPFKKVHNQFLYDVDLIPELGLKKDPILGEVYEALSPKLDTKFEYCNNQVTNVEENLSAKGKRTGDYTVTATFEAKTTANNGKISRYTVTINWWKVTVDNSNKVAYNRDLEKEKGEKLSAVTVAKLDYTADEAKDMFAKAREAAKGKLHNFEFVSAETLGHPEITIENKPYVEDYKFNSENIITNTKYEFVKKGVKIDLDYKQFIKKEEEHLYDLNDVESLKKQSYITFDAKYTVVFSDDGQEPEVTVEYINVNDPVKPMTNADRKEIINASTEVFDGYFKSLNTLLEKKDKASREEALKMFDNEKTGVIVSYKSKDGKERISMPIDAKKYVQRINGESFSVEIVDTQLNGNTVSYTFDQTFKSKAYSDKVTKIVKVGKNENEEYKILSIEVVENTTERL